MKTTVYDNEFIIDTDDGEVDVFFDAVVDVDGDDIDVKKIILQEAIFHGENEDVSLLEDPRPEVITKDELIYACEDWVYENVDPIDLLDESYSDEEDQ